MSAIEPYNEEVRRRFENPVHAGDLDGDYDEVLTSAASASDQGAKIVLCAGVNDGKIASLRFRARGCPHFIAAADMICGALEGSDRIELERLAIVKHVNVLDVPVEKTGKMLLIEDAARGLN